MEIQRSEQLEDKELLTKLKEGDELAFVKIYNQYRNKVYNYAYQLSKSTDTAEEIVQEVFIRIWQKREQINTDFSFQGYIKKITLNHVLNHLKKIAREKALQEEVFLHIAENRNRTEDKLLEKELRKIYEEAVAQLPAQKKLIYQMVRTEELSHEEIAIKLSISKNTVKNHMVEASKFVRDYVRKNGGVICFILASSNYFHSN
ncbi:RNA polymerase sigma-70 factor [Pedobacter gandavensis]|uniref:RNA polymerase sigma factor n=1 Tax=Pedobacter TaxID=84567 RepID=UPI001C99E386|nr:MULTISPECIES: RNA polymerase sigma-70 factor [Pedobacter]WGQ12374.1 RNA polymerase sigma-70 factor [Pedobacter gandavensis]